MTIPSRPRTLPRRRPRGLWGQIRAVLLHPRQFFMGLVLDESQWLLAGLVILGLIGFAAVRRAELSTSFGGGGFAPTGNVSTTWTTALLAAAGIVAGWLAQMLILCETSLFNGTAPRLSLNLRIAIWASLPLALMSALQLIYYAAGGSVGEAGISGLLSEWADFQTFSPLAQALVRALASQFTLFWLWNLALLYIGARHTLRGKWWAGLLAVVMWIALLIIVTAVTNMNAAPAPVVPEFGGEFLP